MNELSLFSGAGGGLLGSLLLGWRPIGYVEFNEYCQRIIAQRIADGILPPAPIFSDVRAFVGEGYAAAYTGLVDIVSGGFPCQPFSGAGLKRGADDERNMWPSTLEVIRIVRPRYCFLENVRGLLWSGYFPQILQELAESGYDARWRVLSAAEVGAPHRRDRVWIACSRSDLPDTERFRPYGDREDEHQRQRQEVRGDQLAGGDGGDRDVACPHNPGQKKSWPIGSEPQNSWSEPCSDRGSWWSVEPDVGRVAYGLAARVDRLKALGNGQVPLVAATAWQILSGWQYD